MTDDLKARALAEAEKLARPHFAAWDEALECSIACDVFTKGVCTCGRPAEVQAIAAALVAWYERGLQKEF